MKIRGRVVNSFTREGWISQEVLTTYVTQVFEAQQQHEPWAIGTSY